MPAQRFRSTRRRLGALSRGPIGPAERQAAVAAGAALAVVVALAGAAAPALAQHGSGLRPAAEGAVGAAGTSVVGAAGAAVGAAEAAVGAIEAVTPSRSPASLLLSPSPSPSPFPSPVYAIAIADAGNRLPALAATRLAAAAVGPASPEAQPADAAAVSAGPSEAQLRRRATFIVGGSALALLAYGYFKWWDEGFGGGLKLADEGFFGRGTEYGGMDKLGHAYSNALGVRAIGSLLQEAGFPRDRAVRIAFWSTTAAFTAIEVLDGLSRRYDLSLQDMAFNLAGAAGTALLMANPELDRLIDYRLSYARSSSVGGWDPFGDYEGQTYWLVAKAEGVPALASNPLTRYLELGLGYRARGFDVPGGTIVDRRRELRLEVGINLSRVLGDLLAGSRHEGGRLHRAADLGFELVQHPLRVGGGWRD